MRARAQPRAYNPGQSREPVSDARIVAAVRLQCPEKLRTVGSRRSWPRSIGSPRRASAQAAPSALVRCTLYARVSGIVLCL
jgi:hypothetical protein